MPTDNAPLIWSSLVLLNQWRAGDARAAEALCSRYFDRLTALARSRLSSRLARRVDPEDIVLSVYRSFFDGARAGRFALNRGGDLWRLLAAITKHKLLRQARHQSAGRRSIDIEVPLEEADERRILQQRVEPTAEDAIALADELEWVFAQLNGVGRRVLELRLQGTELAQIARDTGRSQRTIRRTLAHLRGLLAQRLSPEATPRDSRADPPLDGSLISHRDVLLKRMVGAGRMGKVYEAWQYSARSAVAVKFLRKAFLGQPPVVQRFIGEARIIARLRHPSIVGIRGLGRTPAGAYFLVMDLVTGADLAHLDRTRPIAVRDVVGWALQICDALEHAHARGIIHCDLKPANILLDGAGRIRVTDFGLARSLTGHTQWTGEVEGTAPFMAPEQASRAWGPIGVRTDVYGLGAVVYTLLTGRPPWIGRTLPGILADVTSAAPVIDPASIRPDLPGALSALCRNCLSKAPENRPATVGDVRSALIGLVGRC
jgi:RNA polymerase sigma factor (sigma-70 family)